MKRRQYTAASDARITFRVTERERAHLERAAAREHLDVSSYVRACALGQPLPSAQGELFGRRRARGGKGK